MFLEDNLAFQLGLINKSLLWKLNYMVTLEKIYEIARRRGFFVVSSEIYGGFSGFYDYGPIGTLIKRNIENLWREFFLSLNDNFYEIETSLIMPEKVFIASGHAKNFVDPVVSCLKCGKEFRADHLIKEILGISVEGKSAEKLTEIIRKNNIRCPYCNGELGEVHFVNMMFPVKVGIKEKTKGYLRPETAQGSYVNFSRIFEVTRRKLPLGLAIIGKAFRNEISPRQLLLRQREFTQAELQIFFDPEKIDECEEWENIESKKIKVLLSSESEEKKMTCKSLNSKGIPKFYLHWLLKVQEFFLEKLKIPEERFRFRELSEEEKAFYNKIHFDCEIFFESLGEFKEVGGIHYRTDHDLKGHEKYSKKSQKVFYEGRKFIPHVIEISFGIDRIFLALMDVFYVDDKKRGWVWFKFTPKIAPYLAAVYPLVRKDEIERKAREIYEGLKSCFPCIFDVSGSIGKRYARADEIGVPFSITIDYETLEDETVTIRDRNTTKQKRIKIEEIKNILWKLLNGMNFDEI